VQVDNSKSQSMDNKLLLKEAWSQSCDLFTFWKIINNILEMVQDREIITMEWKTINRNHVQPIKGTIPNDHVKRNWV